MDVVETNAQIMATIAALNLMARIGDGMNHSRANLGTMLILYGKIAGENQPFMNAAQMMVVEVALLFNLV